MCGNTRRFHSMSYIPNPDKPEPLFAGKVCYTTTMIRSFKHKGLKLFFETGNQSGIKTEHTKRLRVILARLDASKTIEDMNLPGLNLHPLSKKKSLDLRGHWGVSISGNWRVTFQFEGNDVINVNYLDYH